MQTFNVWINAIYAILTEEKNATKNVRFVTNIFDS